MKASSGRISDITARRYETSIDVPAELRRNLIDLLTARLADASDLYSQVKQAHRNVKGADSYQLHELFDDLASPLVERVDNTSEGVTTLGGTALGTARRAAATSSLEDISTGEERSVALVRRCAAFAATLRSAATEAEDLRTADTNDRFIEGSRSMDQHLWFLETPVQA